MLLAVDLSETVPIDFAPATVRQEIVQNIRNIFTQKKGQIPYQRDMGVDGRLIDERIELVIMIYQTDMASQVKTYEPRARVSHYDWSESDLINGNLVPKVYIEVKAEYL